MTERSAQYAVFDIEKFFDVPAARVFNAWADPKAKVHWFGPSEAGEALQLDFRVGGREHFTDPMPDGRTFGYDAFYHDIVLDHRIVYAYTVDFDRSRISVSLATVEITEDGKRTRMLYTEQAAYLDGLDTPADREHGTRLEFDKLDAFFAS